MIKRLSILLFLLSGTLLVLGQSKYLIKGIVIDHDTKEALMGANVQVLSLPDSALVKGAMVDDLGGFTIHDLKKARYVLKLSYMGYIPRLLPLNLAEKKSHQVDLGYLTMQVDSKMLQEAVVTTTVAKVQVNGDSLQFNVEAFRVPQGSTLEALVKLLPGAEVDEEGNITINGKSVTKILVDGKEFFLNDKALAMKNIPVEIIDKVKSYDKKSDMARITGVDDGEEETVLDLSVKKGMKNGWFGNATAGVGSERRYNGRGMVNYFNDNTNVSVVGNGRNVPDRQGWHRENGLNSHKEGGVNFATKNPNMETGGSVTYRYDGVDLSTQSNSENFNAERGAFGASQGNTRRSSHALDAQFKMEWRPDSMTTVLFRPNFNHGLKNDMIQSRSGSYDFDVSNLLESEIEAHPDSIVNTNRSRSQSHNTSTYVAGELQITRRFHKKGRNVTLRLLGDYTRGENKQLSAADVSYNLLGTHRLNNRYYLTPSNKYSTTAQLVWSEPLADRLYLHLSYRYTYRYSKNDRQAFIYDSDAYQSLSQHLVASRYDVEEVLRLMRESNYLLRDTVALSQFSEYRNYDQKIRVQIRQVRQLYNFTVGIDAFPQRTQLNYRYMGKEYPEVSRTVFNLVPRVNLRVNFNKTTNLQFRYNGRTSQPSMTNLLDIVDDSNPLNIRRGNPGLKPSFSQSWNANFNSYKAETQRGLWSWLYGNTTRNSISNKTTYNNKTSVRTTMPVNVNGNWNMGGGVGANLGLGKAKSFSVGGNVSGGFTQDVGFYNNTKGEEDVESIRSKTRTTRFNTGGNIAYRNDAFSIELRGNLRLTHARNDANKQANKDDQYYRYGADMKWTLPWGTELATDIFMNSRRGYSQSDMNTDELLWNGSVAQSFLRGNALTLKGEFFDILGQQTNVSRSLSSSGMSDSRNNGIYQYFMFSLIYRFSVFAGRNTMGTSQERR